MALVDDRGTRFDDGGRSFDRQPPQDITAEQSVLGGMLLSKDAIANVVEVLGPGDFYRPAHQILYDCVLDLYGRGEPADAVTLSAELERRGELLRVGGAPYLHTLISTVPTAANAGYYAEIVAEKAVLRRLVEAGTRIVQLGYYGADGADVDDVVDRAQAAVYEVTERRMSEDYVALEELLQPTMDEIDAIASRGGASAGVPTGFADLDAVTNGLHPGQMVIIAARPGIGKALALDTVLPTPAGWTTMGDVAVGDLLLGADGRPTTVVAVTDVMCGRPCHEVMFSDGTIIVADAQHQWRTETRTSRRSVQQAVAGLHHGGQGSFAQLRTTEEIAATLRCCAAEGLPNHSVVNAQPLDLPAQNLIFPPYSLGVRLGAGSPRAGQITSTDPEITVQIEAEGPQAASGALDLLEGERIPAAHLRASIEQRRALLAGLMDAGGEVAPGGFVQFTTTCRELAGDVRELVVSLGHRCEIVTRPVRPGCGEPGVAGNTYTVTFGTDDEVFRLECKRLAHKEYQRYSSVRSPVRYIVDVRPVPSVPVRCVQVGASDHLYLAGESMIPTHNSTLGLDFARSCSVMHGMASVIFSLEMSRTEIVMRLLSAEAKIRLSDMRSGRMSDDDWTRLARRMGEISEAPLFIDDSPNMTMMEIRAKARRLKQRNDLRLIVVDYMQLMTSGRKVESRQQEVSEFSRHLKLLAKELEVPVVTISQLNRGPEQRTDKKPMLADLRESGCLTAATRILRADTGAEVTLGELLDSGERHVPVWSLDERLRMVARPLTHAFPSGAREVFRVTLRSGRMVEATASHPFRTSEGWLPLERLMKGGEGTRVAVPRSVPEPLQPREWPEQQLVLLAGRVATGSSGGSPVPGCGNPLPAEVFGLPRLQMALFLRHLWATEGGPGVADAAGVTWSSTSERFVRDVQLLLLRFSINSRITRTATVDRRAEWVLRVCDGGDQLRFLREIRPCGTGLSDAGEGGREVPPPPATDDVFWDEIADIAALGEQLVYDATVLGTHNFVANGISLHNSLEQDADMVMLIHRPDAWERDDPRAGEADLILAKHRNGPTATVTVAHQLHYSRFYDMAQG